MPPASPSRRTLALATFAIFVVACLPFLRAATFGFVAWDDDVGLANNAAWRGLSAEHVRWMFTTFTLGHWQPLAWLSFGLEHELWGVEPARMHAINVALHGVNAALFFLVARRVLGAGGRDMHAEAIPRAFPGALFGALFAAAFFGVHPLRVETAAWITERAHLLSTAFALGSVLAWLRAADSRVPARWVLASLGLFTLSLASKAWGIALPFALLILDHFLRRVRGLELPRITRLAHVGFLALALLALGVELLAKPDHADVATLAEHDLIARAAKSGAVAFQFIAHTLWPAGLSPLYTFHPGLEMRDVLAALLVLAATLAAFATRRRFPGGFHAWLAVLALLAPVSGIVQAGLQWTADRYGYLAAFPCALWMGAAFERLRASQRWRSVALVGAAAILVALSLASARQTNVWRDSETLWRRVVEVEPASFIGWHNLGTTLHAAGRPRDALEAEQRSVELEPGPKNRDARFHLGQLELLYGDRERAKQAWRIALEQDPNDLRYLEWLAAQQPSRDARRALWSLAFELAPDNLSIRSKLYDAH